VWSPAIVIKCAHGTLVVKPTNKIETIQERALRCMYNDYNSTYENLLIISNIKSEKAENYGH
jgi:hypothetical protein